MSGSSKRRHLDISWDNDDDGEGYDDSSDAIAISDDDAAGGGSDSSEGSESEDPNESADAKRVRLARAYLGKLKAPAGGGAGGGEGSGEGKRGSAHDDDDFVGVTGSYGSGSDDDDIQGRLQRDVRDSRGVLFRALAADVSTCTPTVTIHRGHQSSATCVAMSDDEREAFTGSKDRSVIRWDIETGKIVARFGRKRGERSAKEGGVHTDTILAVDVSTDGKFLASGGLDRTVRVWDLRSNSCVQSFKGHRDSVAGLAFRRFSSTVRRGAAATPGGARARVCVCVCV